MLSNGEPWSRSEFRTARAGLGGEGRKAFLVASDATCGTAKSPDIRSLICNRQASAGVYKTMRYINGLSDSRGSAARVTPAGPAGEAAIFAAGRRLELRASRRHL
jgi:hypothetical protein